MDLDHFTRLCALLTKIDLFGSGPPPVPWGEAAAPAAADIVAAVSRAQYALPRVYREGYAAALIHEAPALAAQFHDRLSPVVVEALAGAVYDHDLGTDVRRELRRFLAVLSDVFMSFVASKRRARLDIPLIGQLPPLAVFQSVGRLGPFTIPPDSARKLLGVDVGVVSLPSTYRTHPVLWSSLAHETGGHDVAHADPALLIELADLVRNMFGGPSHWSPNLTPSQLRALVWSYWIDQASADIYGVLNAGPGFMMNLVAFLSALHQRHEPSLPVPYLSTRSGPDAAGYLDPHPTDILRIHLAIGVLESLRQLASEVRRRYLDDLAQLAAACTRGATEITLVGAVPVRDTSIPINVTVPLAEWQDAARQVGSLLADARVRALGGHGIQDIETWDDVDETNAQSIRQEMLANRSVARLGNDAQLLSGATLALIDNPDLYDAVTVRVDEALDESFRTDEIWGAVQVDRVDMEARVADEPPEAVPRRVN